LRTRLVATNRNREDGRSWFCRFLAAPTTMVAEAWVWWSLSCWSWSWWEDS